MSPARAPLRVGGEEKGKRLREEGRGAGVPSCRPSPAPGWALAASRATAPSNGRRLLGDRGCVGVGCRGKTTTPRMPRGRSGAAGGDVAGGGGTEVGSPGRAAGRARFRVSLPWRRRRREGGEEDGGGLGGGGAGH